MQYHNHLTCPCLNAAILVHVLNYNMNPIKKNKGSAIFLHLGNKYLKPTKGCVAIKKNDFLKILKKITKKTQLIIL